MKYDLTTCGKKKEKELINFSKSKTRKPFNLYKIRSLEEKVFSILN